MVAYLYDFGSGYTYLHYFLDTPANVVRPWSIRGTTPNEYVIEYAHNRSIDVQAQLPAYFTKAITYGLLREFLLG